MPKINTPGKFEAEETYAPHFYEVMGESGQDEDVEIDGMLIAIFSVTAEDIAKFPALRGRDKVAFYESDQGFWTEVRVPTAEEIEAASGDDDEGALEEESEPEESEPEEPDLQNEAVISDSRRGYSLSIEGKHIGDYSDRDDAVEAFRKWTKKRNFHPNLYYMNERGTVDLLNPDTGDFAGDDGFSGVVDEGSAGFIEAVQAQLHIGDRQITFKNRSTLGGVKYDYAAVNFINLPHGVGGAGGGAEAENNRQLFWIEGFGKETPRSPAPTGKISLKQSINNLGREHSLRGKTGTPAQVAKYLADYLNKIAREVEPNFTHTRR